MLHTHTYTWELKWIWFSRGHPYNMTRVLGYLICFCFPCDIAAAVTGWAFRFDVGVSTSCLTYLIFTTRLTLDLKCLDDLEFCGFNYLDQVHKKRSFRQTPGIFLCPSFQFMLENGRV